MSEYTKWHKRTEREGEAGDIIEDSNGEPIALVLSLDDRMQPKPPKEVLSNAQEICALHNMAVSINPEHPEKVAEGMEEALVALQVAETRIHNLIRYYEGSFREALQEELKQIVGARAKITGGK